MNPDNIISVHILCKPRDCWVSRVAGSGKEVNVMVVEHVAAPEVRFMGTRDNPATILHWKADWQVDMEQGFQDLEKAFPNVSTDYYPPLKDAVPEGKPPRTVDVAEKAVKWFPAINAGNLLSEPVK
ncbi:MAG: hypothetical protein QW362_02545 [Candidatus Caldarchaeum sp.]